MPPNWAEIVTAGATVVAVIVAGFAWFTSINTLRSSYRPLLRPVRTRGVTSLLVKNYGKGPALSVLVYEPPVRDDSEPIAEADVVEPLGQPLGPVPKEETRIGRLPLVLNSGTTLRERVEYRILYQDLAGTWHETRLSMIDDQFQATYVGPERWWTRGRHVPKSARVRAQVVRDPEGM